MDKRMIRHRNMSHRNCIEYTIKDDIDKQYVILDALNELKFETLDTPVKKVMKFRVVEGDISEQFESIMLGLGFETIQTMNT